MHLSQDFCQFELAILVVVVLGRTNVESTLVNIQYSTNVIPITDKHLN